MDVVISLAHLASTLAENVPAAADGPSKVLNLPGPIEAMACATGALSGALHASRKQLDVMGVLAVAVCTAVGGGAIRDVLLNSGIPTFLVSPQLLLYALFAATIGTIFAKAVVHFEPVMAVVDTLLIGVWVVIGVQKSLLLGLAPVAVIFVGVVSCIGGGVLRDILCRDRPEAFAPGTLYGAAAFAGAVTYVVIFELGGTVWLCVTATLVVSSALRIAALKFGWATPAPIPLRRASAKRP
jgi:hypothetical protein